MALVADGILTWVERRLSPGHRQRSAAVPIAVAPAALLLIAVAGGAGFGPVRPDTIVVGSKNFTEQVVLGELLAQTLERRGITVTRRLNLGGTFICDRAIRSGDIDAYIEYTGTALAAILKQPLEKEPDAALTSLRNAYGRLGSTIRLRCSSVMKTPIRSGLPRSMICIAWKRSGGPDLVMSSPSVRMGTQDCSRRTSSALRRHRVSWNSIWCIARSRPGRWM